MRIEEGEDEVEGIGDAVGEATEDEDGDTEEEGEGGGHDETATDGKKETGPRTFRQATGEDLGGWLDAIGLGIGDEPCGEQTAHDVTQEDDSEHGPVALETDETCCARIELQTVIDNGGESEGEEAKRTAPATPPTRRLTTQPMEIQIPARMERGKVIFFLIEN